MDESEKSTTTTTIFFIPECKGGSAGGWPRRPQRTAINMAGELGKVHLPLEQLEETLSKLTVPELQQRLKKRGLRKSGVKAKLIQRLAEVCFLLQ